LGKQSYGSSMGIAPQLLALRAGYGVWLATVDGVERRRIV
jgi:hypothetical protein